MNMDNHKPKTIGELIKALTSDEFEMDDEIQLLDNGVLMCRRQLLNGIKLTGAIEVPVSKN